MEPSTDGKKLRRRRARWSDVADGPPGLHPFPGEKVDSKVHDSLEEGQLDQSRQEQDRGPKPTEDEGLEVPKPGSRLERAVSFGRGRIEQPEGYVAMIVEKIKHKGKVPQYRAIYGEMCEVLLTPPTQGVLSHDDLELRRLQAGDVVEILDKTVSSPNDVKTTWVMVRRLDRKEVQPILPVLGARVQSVGLNSGEACVTGINYLVDIKVEEGEVNAEVELQVGRTFCFVPNFNEYGDLLPISWSAAMASDVEVTPKEQGIEDGASGEDVAENFHYVGQEVLDFVATQFGVVGDLTLGGGLTKMILKGGRVFMKGLTSLGGGAPTWGEMISAAVYDMILRKQEDEQDGAATKADREVQTWLGKARKEMTAVEKKLSDKEKAEYTWEEDSRELMAETYVATEMSSKALFFNPAPSHRSKFFKWLGQQMREGNHRAIRRRAIVAVDVEAVSTPTNLTNIQLLDVLQAGKVWKPKSLTLMEDAIVHMEYDADLMSMRPVLERMEKKMLLVEFDSLFEGDRKPLPRLARLQDQLGRYIHNEEVNELEEGFGKPNTNTVRVTMPRQHPLRQKLRHFLQARKPSQCNGAYVEKWVLEFPNVQMAEQWVEENKKMGSLSLFACPEEGFVGGPTVMNLRTNGFVSAEELLFVLQADWVEWIGSRDQAHEYRFSTPASLEVLGAHLYDLNRVRTVGKRKKGKLMNTFWFLETDAGRGMYVKAEVKPPYARPCVQKTRSEETEVILLNDTTEGRWFSVYFGKATMFDLVD